MKTILSTLILCLFMSSGFAQTTETEEKSQKKLNENTFYAFFIFNHVDFEWEDSFDTGYSLGGGAYLFSVRQFKAAIEAETSFYPGKSYADDGGYIGANLLAEYGKKAAVQFGYSLGQWNARDKESGSGYLLGLKADFTKRLTIFGRVQSFSASSLGSFETNTGNFRMKPKTMKLGLSFRF